MARYRRNPYRMEVINRFGQTVNLPLFEQTSRRLPEPTRSRFEGAPKSIAVATDTRKLSHLILTHDKRQLTNKQLAVLGAIIDIGPASNEEIAHHLGWEINRVVGRTFELRQYGIVVLAGKRKCRRTGMIVSVWQKKNDPLK